MNVIDFVCARDALHAVQLLAQRGASARLLAGGTDLLPDLKQGAPGSAALVDISRAEDLKGIELTADGLRIGAGVTHAEIIASALIREHVPALAEAARAIGAVQTRNLGTIGGNLAAGVPCMDSGPGLIVLDARVRIAALGGFRTLPLSELLIGPRRTALQPAEVLVEIVVPREHLGRACAFLKFGLRKGQALALVNAAASMRVDRERGVFIGPRIALGAVAPTVIRALQAEAYLDNRVISAQSMAEAGRIAASEARPISDFRASAQYRRDIAAVLTRRVLEAALDRARALRPGAGA